jgi:redox-sensitive bicupin YhaK (pirin superfamily)
MISIVKSSERHHYKNGWLSTYWHFSFDDYYDPRNMGWGALRVFNDDVVSPGGIFPMHPHANFDVVTIVLEGALMHKDSAGNSGVIAKDEVAMMGTGGGIMHSEETYGEEPVHLLQIWIEQKVRGLAPSWKKAAYTEKEIEGKLYAIASGRKGIDAPLQLNRDAAIYRAKIEKGEKIEYAPTDGEMEARATAGGKKAAGAHEFASSGAVAGRKKESGGSIGHAAAGIKNARRAYVFVISGSLLLNKSKMEDGDSAKIADENKLEFSAGNDGADFVFFDLP